MQPLELGGGGAARPEFGAQPHFNRLHIVIGARFDLLDGRHVGGRGVLGERGEQLQRGGRQPGQSLRGRAARERQNPGALHAHPLAHQAGFAEYPANGGELAGIAAVQGRKRV